MDSGATEDVEILNASGLVSLNVGTHELIQPSGRNLVLITE